MVRTGNVDFSCKRLTSIEIRKSKYHIIRRVRFRWDPPLRKISGSAHVRATHLGNPYPPLPLSLPLSLSPSLLPFPMPIFYIANAVYL